MSKEILLVHPERIDYYDSDTHLLCRCNCDIPLIYRIQIKKLYKSPHVYKYECADCGYIGEAYDCNLDCSRCELTTDECIHSHRI